MSNELIQIFSSVFHEILALPRFIGAGFIWLFSGLKWSYEYYFEEYANMSLIIGLVVIVATIFSVF